MDPTRQTLLIKIRDADDAVAWSDFTTLYTPIIQRFALSRGVSLSDVDDLTQEVLKSIASAIKKFEYDPEKGTFRSWLFRVVRSKLANHFNKQAKQPAQGSGRTTIHRLVEEDTPSDTDVADWDLEYKKHMFSWAAEKVRPEFTDQSWAAFQQTAVEEKTPKDVAANLGITVGAVYIAKSRIIARLREVIQSVTGDLEPIGT
ncbi:MAG: sigma-70 family RNA polymerase sigma factor [Verrucomicrobiota bacterium]